MRNNDIVFFNLHRRYQDYIPTFGGFLGIYLLSAFVNANGYSGQGFDGTLHKGRIVIDELCKNQMIKMVGLYCDYANVTENIWLSKYVKETYGLPVIIGGPQATSLSEEFLKESKCDALVYYEGELTVVELMDYFLDGVGDLSTIKGIGYLDANHNLIQTENREIIKNLDALPFIDDECYLLGKRNKAELSVMTGRGCPFRCTFCHEGKNTKPVRYRSVQNVIKEIRIFLESTKDDDLGKLILFTDDTFTIKPERVKELCDELKKLRNEYDFRWFCEGHAGLLYRRPEMIKHIAEAGCYRIQLGIEAGTQKVLDAYNKKVSPEELKEVVKLCRDYGISQIYGNIILGSAFFIREIYEQDLKFALELLTIGEGTVEIGVVSYWPLPETAITSNPDKYQISIVDKNFDTSVDDFPQTETDEFSVWDIQALMQDMQNKLIEHMKHMLINCQVPMSRIIEWHKSSTKYITKGMWLNILEQLPHLFAYSHLLSVDEVLQSHEIDNLLFAKPMRVISLAIYAKQLASGGITICDVQCSELERDILVLCTGRNNVDWIYARLTKTNRNFAKEDLLSALKKLETNFLITYCKE